MNKTELLAKITEKQTHAVLESRKYKNGSKDSKFYSGMIYAFQDMRAVIYQLNGEIKEWSLFDAEKSK